MQFEEKLDRACCNPKGHEADSPIRKVTGWFSDMSTAFGGYSLSKIVQYPRLYLDRGYRRSFGGQDLGGEDAGFIAMMYGYATCSALWSSSPVQDLLLARRFGVFFLCIALAPSTCFGAWVALPVWWGTLPLDQAADLVSMYWWDLLMDFLAILTKVEAFLSNTGKVAK